MIQWQHPAKSQQQGLYPADVSRMTLPHIISLNLHAVQRLDAFMKFPLAHRYRKLGKV
eukprot:m.226150 g.226150  ORF g.226150 m.226150 type:complete len:58 (+) comp17045_c2_seq7:7724-7897(+)